MEFFYFKISLFIMGLSGMVAQIILLRELLVSFFGNELTLGIIIANFLILEAIGSFYIGRTAEARKRKIEIYIIFQLIFSISLPVAIYLSRLSKNIILSIQGEAIGFFPILYSSFLIILPVAIPHGALFTYGCKLYAQFLSEKASSIGKVYVMETVGSIIGGLLITFIMIQYLTSFEIAFIISLINSIISFLMLWTKRGQSPDLLKKSLLGVSTILTIIFFLTLFTPLANKIHLQSIQSQWKGLNPIHNENSIYGNITVTKRGEQFTFFTDGVPSITTPVPDIATIENFVHFSMLSHENPESILILSGGAGGMIFEILKYPVKRVDYVELDPLLLKLIQKFSTPITEYELHDQRVRVHFTDGSFFIKRASERYDIIFIGLSAPQELQTNRLFSSEFFSIAKKRLAPGGIIVLMLPGSLTYISPELKDLNGCIWDTLKSVFRSVRIIPGDTNIYLVSNSDNLNTIKPDDMIKRLKERGIKTSLMTKNYIEYRLNERWQKWFEQSMQGRKTRINSDFHPLAVFLNLSYWNSLFSPYLVKIFKWFEGLSLKITAIVITIFTIFFSFLFFRKPNISKYSLPYTIFTSGITDMILHLTIILTFQTFYGYLYHQIGLLVTLFMVGAALSCLYITKHLDKMKNGFSVFLILESWVIIFSLFLPLIFLIPSYHLEKIETYYLLYSIFLITSFLCGTLVGFQFPMATKIYLDAHLKDGIFGETAGLLYSADLLGGFLGGLLGGIFFLPILGFKDTCLVMAIIKASSLFLFLIFTKLQK